MINQLLSHRLENGEKRFTAFIVIEDEKEANETFSKIKKLATMRSGTHKETQGKDDGDVEMQVIMQDNSSREPFIKDGKNALGPDDVSDIEDKKVE